MLFFFDVRCSASHLLGPSRHGTCGTPTYDARSKIYRHACAAPGGLPPTLQARAKQRGKGARSSQATASCMKARMVYERGADRVAMWAVSGDGSRSSRRPLAPCTHGDFRCMALAPLSALFVVLLLGHPELPAAGRSREKRE
eukprot:scaffold5154_cov191-Isochrysis_galbana.AAC.1